MVSELSLASVAAIRMKFQIIIVITAERGKLGRRNMKSGCELEEERNFNESYCKKGEERKEKKGLHIVCL